MHPECRNSMSEECIDNYVNRRVHDHHRAQAIREAVKDVILSRHPVGQVEKALEGGSKAAFVDAVRRCKTRLSRVFGHRGTPQATLDKMKELGEGTTFQQLWLKFGSTSMKTKVAQKRRRIGEKAADEPKPKAAKIASQPSHKAVTFAEDVAQMPASGHEVAEKQVAQTEEVDALKEEIERLQGQNADLKRANEELRVQKAADARKLEELNNKVAVLCGLVQGPSTSSDADRRAAELNAKSKAAEAQGAALTEQLKEVHELSEQLRSRLAHVQGLGPSTSQAAEPEWLQHLPEEHRQRLEDWTVGKPTRLRYVKDLGRGADGVVSMVQTELAMKTIDAGKCAERAKNFCDESDFAMKHNHKNMVPCLSKSYGGRHLYLVMPLMKLGELFKVTKGALLSKGEAAHVIRELLNFFVFFHE